jgi:prolyl 4-hydroxylase
MNDVLSNIPLIILFQNFLTVEECDNILNKDIEFSKSAGYKFDTGLPEYDAHRISSTYFDTKNELALLQEKVFNTVKTYIPNNDFSIANLENAQIQKYQVGEEYKYHCDFFNYPTVKQISNDRIATMITYLNDEFEGGETEFTILNIKIKPKKGMGLFFYYGYDYNLNLKTQHAGNPVTSGYKQIMTTWMRNKAWIS